MSDVNQPVATATGADRSAATKVIWDDSRMASSYANVCNVQGTREEIMLLFGSNQGWNLDQKEINVVLSNCIVLNPHAAKRLINMLENGLREYENRCGELKL